MAHVVKLYTVRANDATCGGCVLFRSDGRGCRPFRQLDGTLAVGEITMCPILGKEFRIAELDQPTDNVYAIGVLEDSDG